MLVLALLCSFATPGRITRVQLVMESTTVEKGKKVISKAGMYFDATNGDMVTHFTYPLEQVLVSNRFGEVKVYDPNSNSVAIKQDPAFSSKGTMLHFFLGSNSTDLGLRDMGFSLTNTEYDQQHMVSTWNAPPQMAEGLSKVELVHDGYRPVFMAYHGAENGVVREVFFGRYQEMMGIEVPGRITEINYFEEGRDSAVTRIDFSNFLLNEQAQSDYFNFEIPENAKVVK